MTDLPAQWPIQQAHARPISGEELEAFGKKAAACYLNGSCPTLNESVVTTVKHAGLSPEQVRRVIEFTNTSAYLTEFNKEGSAHRVIEFNGGPADAGTVLRDLNDGGGGTVFDRGLSDYASPPTKTASAVDERAFEQMFAAQETRYPDAHPEAEMANLRDKLAGLYEDQTSQLSGLEADFMGSCDRLFENVKEAALSGLNLGEVLFAWQHVTPEPEYVKCAFSMLSERLISNDVFQSFDAIGESLTKTGSANRHVDLDHPLLDSYAEYCATLTKLAALREARDEVESALNDATGFLVNFETIKSAGVKDRLKLIGQALGVVKKEAPPQGVLQKTLKGFANAGEAVGRAGESVGEVLLGKGHEHAKAFGDVPKWVITHAPHIAGAGLAVRGLQHVNAAKQTPMGQTIASFVPGTNEYAMKQQEIAMRYAGYPMYPQQY